ncbi:MAG: two-component system, OmpR family, response regulator MprA [Acidimicrobiaceae bacterium]|nr:two-component system, OmpR family, response regulator MprA [Acidimicrobiaceae bacterium]
MRVLICDDEPHIRLLYRSEFEFAGAEVVVAGDGQECVDTAVREHPELIVLDIRMPNRDGLSALAELHERCPESQVLMVTAEFSIDNFSRARELGAVECIDKLDFLGRIPALLAQYTAA